MSLGFCGSMRSIPTVKDSSYQKWELLCEDWLRGRAEESTRSLYFLRLKDLMGRLASWRQH